MSQSQKNYKIDAIDYLEPLSYEVLHRIGNFELLQPITFELSYDMSDSLWCLENHGLALEGYGTSYNDAMRCLEENIEGHVLSFTRFPDSKQSEESLFIKKELQKYIDFTQVLAYLSERDL